MGKLDFTIDRNRPAKYIGENRYLTDWEKQMKKAIEKIIDEEMKEKEDRLNIGLQTVINERKRPITMIDLDLLNEDGYRRKRIEELETKYRIGYTLRILEKRGLDIETFLKTFIGSCKRIDLVLGCVQDKIDGFDYDEKGQRLNNCKPMDINNMSVEYKDNTLRISDGINQYDVSVDEHQIIYVNGEKVFNLSNISTNEEERKMLQDLFDNLRSDRELSEQKDWAGFLNVRNQVVR